jgi:hypothetical protein
VTRWIVAAFGGAVVFVVGALAGALVVASWLEGAFHDHNRVVTWT